MSIKVLYISHLRENSGHSKAAQENILALDSAGVEVVPRTIKLNQTRGYVPQRILDLENRSSVGCTHVIQHVLPHHMEYNGSFKNIGYFVYETFGLNKQACSWYSKLGLMDEVWVANQTTALEISHYNTRIVPHPTNIDKYNHNYDKPKIDVADGGYKFYTIADMNKRKNFSALIRAFHLAFTPNEPVSLIIKTSKYGLNPKESAEAVLSSCNEIKRAMKLYRNVEDYNQEIILTSHFTDEQIYGLHQYCDCFVNTSHGEGFSIPTFDAFGFNKQLIVPGLSTMYEFPKCNGVYKFDVSQDSIIGYDDTFFEIGSANESWLCPNIKSLARCMRKAYECRDSKIEPRYLEKYSRQSVGNMMKDYLERL